MARAKTEWPELVISGNIFCALLARALKKSILPVRAVRKTILWFFYPTSLLR